MIESVMPVQQLAILGSEREMVAKFVQTWLQVNVISVGFVHPIAVPSKSASIHVAHTHVSQKNEKLTERSARPALGTEAGSSSSATPLIPSATFSRQLIKTKKRPAQLPLTTKEIRALYKNPPTLKPEPRGERTGFFVQAEYFVKGVGATFGLLSLAGLYYAARWAQKRF
jgi:hypothetical protein